MLKKTIIGFMLALFAGPLSAHAELPGQPCTAAQIGTTKMADDQQNIIACLVTGKAKPENVQEWKSMSSGGGGGITGGCSILYVSTDHMRANSRWGKGCRPFDHNAPGTDKEGIYRFTSGSNGICASAAATGYSCGGSWAGIQGCICVKE
ncbi:MAG: hypothetical protein IPI58_07200 [Alphaproteobacteria bacterium]|nr:MAG: hypothetical protein IPI58_07200 [Alphaproteobacteria bacterium]